MQQKKKKKKKNEKKKKLESVLMKLKNDKNQTLLRKALYINFICLSVQQFVTSKTNLTIWRV